MDRPSGDAGSHRLPSVADVEDLRSVDSGLVDRHIQSTIVSAPRVRFAPSPTGYLHIGGARTALFNWLFARRHGGVFVLRIEDTDTERSSEEMVAGILDGLRWLGLDWDEGPMVAGPHAPYFQSQRQAKYLAVAERLVADGQAYYCYCTPEELKAKREGNPEYKYERTCLRLPADEIRRREEAGQARAVRFKVTDGSVRVDDLVHGPIEFDASLIEDFVILRSDGHPTYHLSVVADDVEMGMTHVVRGDDHISNTPKQILLYQAMGAAVPKFAHVPLILGADKKRLSKRHGATSVMEYAGQGYIPEAMVNFLALLGWSPGAGNREVFARDELAQIFALEGISGGQRRLQSREARLVQPAAPRAPRSGGAGAAAQAVVRRSRAVVGRSADDPACLVFRRARAARAAGEAAAGFCRRRARFSFARL